jgi:AcrR family transcriptional regulator
MAPTRLTREESRAQTRERLLQAARHAFARGGYGGASVDEIAAEAGYTKGAFYSNFATKEAIFLELLSRHMAGEAEQLARLVDADAPPAQILASLDLWLDAMNEDADWPLLAMELQLQARRSPEFAAEYDALQAVHRGRLGGLLRALFEKADRRLPAPAEDLAAGFIALAHGLVLQGTGPAGQGSQAGGLIKLLLRSLISAAPKARKRS